MFASPTFTGTVSGVTATHVGLGSVTNESKATMFESPTFTGTVSGVTATHVGLGNVTNESKATMFASPTFTGTVAGVTATHVGLGNVTNESKATMFASPTFTGTVAGVTATHVGLGNVTNESKATMFASPTFTGTVAAFSSATHTLTASSNLVFTGSSSGAVTFQAGATPSAQTYTLPAAYPAANGYALVSTTGGTLSWASAGGGTSLPTQTGNAGKMLITDGTTASWSLFTSTLFNVGSRPFLGGTKQFLYSEDAGSNFAWVSMPEFTYRYIWLNSSSAFSSSTRDAVLRFKAGTNMTITAETNGSDGQNYNTLVFNSTGGAGGGITWTTNTSPSGTITVTNPTGYNTSGSTMVIVVVGISVSSSNASSGSGSFSTAMSVGMNTRVFYTYTTSSLGATTTISGITGYAMAYSYIGSGPSIATSSTSTSGTSTTLMNPSPVYGSPRIIAMSQSSSLNLATLAGPATGGGATWAAGTGYQHPNDSSLSAAVWVGTGSWTTMATPTITSNSSFNSWYLTGITIG
jgi:hypothetical protein